MTFVVCDGHRGMSVVREDESFLLSKSVYFSVIHKDVSVRHDVHSYFNVIQDVYSLSSRIRVLRNSKR